MLVNSGTTKSWTLTGQATHPVQKQSFLRRSVGLVTLGAAWLTQYPACSSLGDLIRPQTTTYFFDSSSASFGAHQFPLAASLRISMSKAWFATSFFKRTFSCCKAFSSFAIAGAIPPYF